MIYYAIKPCENVKKYNSKKYKIFYGKSLSN